MSLAIFCTSYQFVQGHAEEPDGLLYVLSLG